MRLRPSAAVMSSASSNFLVFCAFNPLFQSRTECPSYFSYRYADPRRNPSYLTKVGMQPEKVPPSSERKISLNGLVTGVRNPQPVPSCCRRCWVTLSLGGTFLVTDQFWAAAADKRRRRGKEELLNRCVENGTWWWSRLSRLRPQCMDPTSVTHCDGSF